MRAGNDSSNNTPISTPKIPVKVYRGINELINMEKNFHQDMADFVRLFEESMIGLNKKDRQTLMEYLPVYKELSKLGALAQLKELQEDSTPAEVAAAIKLINLSMQSKTPEYMKKKVALARASVQSTVFGKLLASLIKGSIFSKITGNKFKNIFTKKYAQYVENFNKENANKPARGKAVPDPMKYLNSTLLKPTQVAMRYIMPMAEIIAGIKENESILPPECGTLMVEALSSSKELALGANSAMATPKTEMPKQEKVKSKPEPKPTPPEIPKPPMEVKKAVVPEKTPPIKNEIKEDTHKKPRKHHASSRHSIYANHAKKTNIPVLKSEVALIDAILKQNFAKSRLQIVKIIRNIINDNDANKLERIKAEVSKELLVGRKVGFASRNYESNMKLRNLLRDINAGIPSRLEKYLHSEKASHHKSKLD